MYVFLQFPTIKWKTYEANNCCKENIEGKLRRISLSKTIKWKTYEINNCTKENIEGKLRKNIIFENNKNNVLIFLKFLKKC